MARPVIEMSEMITVGALAKRLSVKPGQVIAKLMGGGMMVTVNQTIDYETAAFVAEALGFEVQSAQYRMAVDRNQYVPIPAEAWFNPETGRLVVGVFMDKPGKGIGNGIEDAQSTVKTAKVAVVDWKGSNGCKLDLWPYSEPEKS